MKTWIEIRNATRKGVCSRTIKATYSKVSYSDCIHTNQHAATFIIEHYDEEPDDTVRQSLLRKKRPQSLVGPCI